MAGCFGSSFEDRSRERQLFRYLDSLDEEIEPSKEEVAQDEYERARDAQIERDIDAWLEENSNRRKG